MTCTQSSLSTGQMSISLTPSYVSSASLSEGTCRLMVSDSPETPSRTTTAQPGTAAVPSGMTQSCPPTPRHLRSIESSFGT